MSDGDARERNLPCAGAYATAIGLAIAALPDDVDVAVEQGGFGGYAGVDRTGK